MADIDVSREAKDKMLERGHITLNGFEFKIIPVFLGEEEEYLNDLAVTPVPIKEDGQDEDFTDKQLKQHIIALFSAGSRRNSEKDLKSFRRVWCLLLKKLGFKKHYYVDSPAHSNVKWIQKKVFYKGKSVCFYDLERKFELSKSEIELMLVELHKLSGF